MSAPAPLRFGPRALRATLVAAFALLTTIRPAGFHPLAPADAWTYDHILLPLLPPAPTRDDIAIVRVDDRTLDDLGERWPLSRATWARFIERARAWRPALIVLDVVFDQPNDTTAIPFGEAVLDRADALGLTATAPGRALASFVDEELERVDADRQLSRALAEAGNVVLGAFFTRTPSTALGADAAGRLTPVAPGPHDLALVAFGAVTSHPRLAISALTSGAMNVLVDADGTVRRYPYAVGVDGQSYASLALAAVTVSARDRAASDALAALALARDGAAPRLRFRPADKPFLQLGFSDLLLSPDDGADAGAALAGKTLFVGAAALGIEDQVRTPLSHRTPGVEVHATAAENLLLGSFIIAGGPAQVAAAAETLVVLALLALLLARGPGPGWVLAGGAAALAVHLGLAVGLAVGPGWLIDLVAVPAGVVALGATELGVRWRAVKRERAAHEAREAALAAERDALARFRRVVDTVGDAIVTIDEQDRVAWMNPAAEALFMRRLATAEGLPIGALVPAWAGGAAALRPPGAEEAAGDGGRGPGASATWEAEAALPGGAPLAVEVTTTPMAMGSRTFVNAVFRNVTARKAIERLKDEFVSTVNHELRTPVTSILGSLKLVQGGVGGSVPEAAGQLVDIALHNGERLLSLVNELLDLARLEAGALEDDHVPLDLGAVVARAVEANRGFGARFGVTLALALEAHDVRVRGHAGRLEQVVTNLVSNAVKHSPSPGEVGVRVSLTAEGRARVAVVDRGPGIPAAFRAHIFEKFATTAAGDGRKRPGTGLGLAIARRIVEAHGGRIGFDSEVAVGTTFYFEVPPLA